MPPSDPIRLAPPGSCQTNFRNYAPLGRNLAAPRLRLIGANGDGEIKLLLEPSSCLGSCAPIRTGSDQDLNPATVTRPPDPASCWANDQLNLKLQRKGKDGRRAAMARPLLERHHT